MIWIDVDKSVGLRSRWSDPQSYLLRPVIARDDYGTCPLNQIPESVYIIRISLDKTTSCWLYFGIGEMTEKDSRTGFHAPAVDDPMTGITIQKKIVSDPWNS
jgi:hypothetical protein